MTTTKKTTAQKSTAKKTAEPKSALAKKTTPATPRKPTIPTKTPPPVTQAKPAVVNAPQPVVVGPPKRKKEIIEDVVARSGLKKRDIKPIVDHLLAVMGDAMADGRELVVPPFGRVKVHKKKDAAKKTIFFAKVHRNVRPVVGGTSPVDGTGD